MHCNNSVSQRSVPYFWEGWNGSTRIITLALEKRRCFCPTDFLPGCNRRNARRHVEANAGRGGIRQIKHFMG